jgi:cytochrome c biogenesis protein CcdA
MLEWQGNARGSNYALLALATAAVAVVGYLGYVFYPRFDLPAATGATLLVVAAGAGIASFFSPCSFPLLLSMLARPIAAEAQADRGRPFRKAATFAAALSVGASSFLILVGLGIAGGASTYFDDVTFTSAAGITIRIRLTHLTHSLAPPPADDLPERLLVLRLSNDLERFSSTKDRRLDREHRSRGCVAH